MQFPRLLIVSVLGFVGACGKGGKPEPGAGSSAAGGGGGGGGGAATSGLAGVWIGVTSGGTSNDLSGGTYFDATKMKVEWRALFGNGQAFSGLPTVGLADLDAAQHQREAATGAFVGGAWGTWAMSGASGSATYGGPAETLELRGGDLVVDGHPFVRAADVTGLRLDGAYTYMDPTDSYLDQPGCRQVIQFRPDGGFVDRGVFVSDCTAPGASPMDAPGAGTYEVRDYSLILSYSDGRVVRRSLTGVVKGDPKQDARQLFVVGQLWQRR